MAGRIVLAGGSGFIGRALAKIFAQRGNSVVALTRGNSSQESDVRYEKWDGRTIGGWIDVIDGAAAVVNLAGKSINCRHTAENRREILHSRVESVRLLGKAIARSATPPRVMVQASAVGFYGDTGDCAVNESAPQGSDFMAEVCREWEAAFDQLQLPATRKVTTRIGVVLGCGGGMLEPLARLTRMLLGGAAGSGRQFISWIHIDDLAEIFRFAVERDEARGIFNATSPNPATNAEFMRELRRVLRRPWSPPAPAPLVRLGAWLMGAEGELALQSTRAVPMRLLNAGFGFAHPTLRDALRDLYTP